MGNVNRGMWTLDGMALEATAVADEARGRERAIATPGSAPAVERRASDVTSLHAHRVSTATGARQA